MTDKAKPEELTITGSAREFKIHFDHGIAKVESFGQNFVLNTESVHVIEKSAFVAQSAQISRLEKALKSAIGDLQCMNDQIRRNSLGSDFLLDHHHERYQKSIQHYIETLARLAAK